jgi:hypothetical protein
MCVYTHPSHHNRELCANKMKASIIMERRHQYGKKASIWKYGKKASIWKEGINMERRERRPR